MAIRIVQLGSDRSKDEGLRIGTVRRPPRGVPRSQYAAQNWYDVWLPNLAPSVALLQKTQILKDKSQWKVFERLSHHANFSVGCYCADEQYCHRSILRRALRERGAVVLNG